MENQINASILSWWQQLPDKFKASWPTLVHPMNKQAPLLFVGLNPSGVDSKQGVISIEHMPKDELAKKVSEIVAHEYKCIFEGGYKRYYNPLNAIAKELKMEFEYYDLFHVAYRDSKVLEEELFDSNGLKDLHKEHFANFINVLSRLKPKVVIVNNIVSSKIIKSQLGDLLVFDNDLGMYSYHGSDFKTLFFFNGIMSYGRLSAFERERLIWMIKRAVC
jgi:hypothetical protein